MSLIVSGQLLASESLWDFDGDQLFEEITSVDMNYLSPFRLLLCLAHSDVTGMLGVETGEETIAVTVSKGQILKTASSHESDDELLGRVLVRDRLISVEKLEEAAEMVDETDRDLAHSIFEMHLMDTRNMVRAIKAMHRERVFRIMASKDSTYTFARSDALGGRIATSPTHESMLRPLSQHLHDELRHFSFEDIEPRLQPIRHCKLLFPPARKSALRDHPFGERELHVIDRMFRGNQSLDDILQLQNTFLDHTARLIFQLFIFDLLDILGVWE